MSSAGNILKMLVGIVIFVIGIVWYIGPRVYIGNYGLFEFWDQLKILLEGTIGLFLLFVGLIVAWMGYDDYKMDMEMAKEEKETKEEPKEESK